MGYISQYAYYNDPANYGSYQYVSLEDIVKNFQLMFSGNHSLVNNEERFKIIFHAKQAIKELNIDAFKEIKALQLNVDENLRFILPSDYVNWCKISLYKDGWIRPLTENIQVNSTIQYSQNTAGTILFDINEDVIYVDPSRLNQDRLDGVQKSIYLNPGSPLDGSWGWYVDGSWYFVANIGTRFGLNTETANFNPTFRIDNKSGVINFSSDMEGESVILEYISDGMENGIDTDISINKMFEKYIYAYINYEILDKKLGVQEYIINRARKEKSALLRNARIRIGNFSPGKLLMAMRGDSKWIK